MKQLIRTFVYGYRKEYYGERITKYNDMLDVEPLYPLVNGSPAFVGTEAEIVSRLFGEDSERARCSSICKSQRINAIAP